MPCVEAKHVSYCRRWCVLPGIVVLEVVLLGVVVLGLLLTELVHAIEGGREVLFNPVQLRSRRKAAKMLVAVVVMFAVCYFPVHLLSVLRYTLDMEQNDAITLLALLSHVMCYANSAINPLIYNFMSGKYRREFRRAFCCTSKPIHETLTITTRTLSRNRKQGSLQSDKDQRDYACNPSVIRNGIRNTYLQ